MSCVAITHQKQYFRFNPCDSTRNNARAELCMHNVRYTRAFERLFSISTVSRVETHYEQHKYTTIKNILVSSERCMNVPVCLCRHCVIANRWCHSLLNLRINGLIIIISYSWRRKEADDQCFPSVAFDDDIAWVYFDCNSVTLMFFFAVESGRVANENRKIMEDEGKIIQILLIIFTLKFNSLLPIVYTHYEAQD